MEELEELEERFQPFLRENDYTFIGPVDMNLMENFIRTANMLVPVVGINRSVHHALSHRDATRAALNNLPQGSELRIFVVLNEAEDFLFHATIEEYCDRFNIDFE